MVMVARALAQETEVIVMDEPTSHLDLKHELSVMQIICRLVRDTGRSVIMATHFPNHGFYFENNQVNTRIALLSDSGFLAVGSPTSVMTEENLRTIYKVEARVVSCDLGQNQEIKQVVPVNPIV